MTREQAERLTAWLADTAGAIDYGTVTVTITRHDGQTREITKTTTTKDRQTSPGGTATDSGKRERRYGAT